MKFVIAIAFTLVGIVLGLGELAYTHYFAGEKVAAVTMFDGGEPKHNKILVAAEDLPVRLNMRIFGARRTVDVVHRYSVTVTTGGDEAEDTISFFGSVDETDDLATLSVESGKFDLRPSDFPSMAQASQLFVLATPGQWDLSVAVTSEEGFEVNRIVADVIFRSRAIRWQIAGPGLGILLIGFVLLIVCLRERFPHLAK